MSNDSNFDINLQITTCSVHACDKNYLTARQSTSGAKMASEMHAPRASCGRNPKHFPPQPCEYSNPRNSRPWPIYRPNLSGSKKEPHSFKMAPEIPKYLEKHGPTIFPKIYFKNSYLPRFLTKFNLQGVILSATPRAFQWRHEARNRPKSARNMNHRKFPGVIFQKFVTPASFGRF